MDLDFIIGAMVSLLMMAGVAVLFVVFHRSVRSAPLVESRFRSIKELRKLPDDANIEEEEFDLLMQDEQKRKVKHVS